MAKYTDRQLKVMAQEVLHMRSVGDSRVMPLIELVYMMTNVPIVDIMNRITFYANMECN